MQHRWLIGLLGLLAFTCDDADSPPDDVAGACRRQAECSGEFAEPERQCRDRFEAEYEEAASYGCGSAYADRVSCLATTRGSRCPPPLAPDDSDGPSAEPEPYVDACAAVEQAFSDCQGRMQQDE